jgi:hypothetical protein
MLSESGIQELVEVSRKVRNLCAEKAYVYANEDLPDAVSAEDIEEIINSGCAVQLTSTKERRTWRWAGYDIDHNLVGFAFHFRMLDRERFYFTNVSPLRSPDKIPDFDEIFKEVTGRL